jgi:PAS domain S-box-containing protein
MPDNDPGFFTAFRMTVCGGGSNVGNLRVGGPLEIAGSATIDAVPRESLPLAAVASSEESFRILLVEDCPCDIRLIREMLRDVGKAFTLAHASPRLTDALEALESQRFDLALLDLTLPDSSGLKTFSAIRSRVPDLPIIVFSGLDDQELAVRTLQEGAQDYLVKGRIEPELLVRSMRHAIERARVERALAQERDMLNSLLDHIPDRVFFKDLQGRYLRINQAMVRLFGLNSRDAAVGRSDFDFFPRDQASQTFADEQRVIETGEPIIGQMERKTLPDGRTSWTLTTKLPLRDRDERVIGTTGISRDVSQLKEMEEALAAERNLLRSVIDNIPAPIYVKDAAGRYMMDNIAHVHFLGKQSKTEVIGKTVFDFFSETAAAKFDQDDSRIMAGGEPLLNHEEKAVDDQGRELWLSTTKVPLRRESGEICGLVCIGQDITERKLAEERLRVSNEELSAALASLKQAHEEMGAMQLQLIEAEKMKTIGRLAAGVAHEVKNPLAIITMGLDYLKQQDHSGDPAVPMILRDLSDAVKRADMVIRGMLDYSAPKTLRLDAEDLNDIIEYSLLLIAGELDAVRHTVVKELQPDLPRVRLDRMKMEQVFVNVFTNAIHAMPDGGTLTVRTFSRQLTGVGANIGDERSESFRVGQMVVIAEVEDTGHGVPPDKLNKVFDPFFTTKPTGQGTGLGLSVTRSIMDLHGGTIALRNRETGGVTVTLTLGA